MSGGERSRPEGSLGEQSESGLPRDIDDLETLFEMVPAAMPEDLIGLTERERRFGQAYFEVALEVGDNQGSLLRAYRRAFPMAENDERSALVMARALMRAPRVQSLVAHLRIALASRSVLPASRVVMELERVAYANFLDYVRIEGDGSARLDMTRMDQGMAAAVREVDIREKVLVRRSGEGEEVREVVDRTIKLKLHDKMGALDKLARVHRMYGDQVNPNFTVEDLDRLIRRMELQLEARGAVIDAEVEEVPATSE